MSHTQGGESKILPRCTLPLTAKNKVNLIITEKAVLEVTPQGLVLKETGPDTTTEEVVQATAAKLIIPDKVGKFG
jgi:acyl CoA:acetate/3-ketoacid CoA transferase beta subunit